MNFCKAGTRVWHKKHGKGTVTSTIRGDEGIRIKLDNGGTKTVSFTKHDPLRGYVDDLPYPKGWRKYKKQANEDTMNKAKEVVNQLLEGPRASGPDWKLSRAGRARIDKFAAAAQAAEVEPGAPFNIDAEFARFDGSDLDAARELARAFNLAVRAKGPNGNPLVVGRLKTKRDVLAFARRYGSQAVFEPAANGRGTDVFFE